MSRPEVETPRWLEFAKRIIRRAGQRVAEADDWELAELATFRDDVEAAIIADGLGITRQGAQQRYGTPPPTPTPAKRTDFVDAA